MLFFFFFSLFFLAYRSLQLLSILSRIFPFPLRPNLHLVKYQIIKDVSLDGHSPISARFHAENVLRRRRSIGSEIREQTPAALSALLCPLVKNYTSSLAISPNIGRPSGRRGCLVPPILSPCARSLDRRAPVVLIIRFALFRSVSSHYSLIPILRSFVSGRFFACFRQPATARHHEGRCFSVVLRFSPLALLQFPLFLPAQTPLFRVCFVFIPSKLLPSISIDPFILFLFLLLTQFFFPQAIRRSLKGDRDPKPHISVTPKSAIAILPPKKVGLIYILEPGRSRGHETLQSRSLTIAPPPLLGLHPARSSKPCTITNLSPATIRSWPSAKATFST